MSGPTWKQTSGSKPSEAVARSLAEFREALQADAQPQLIDYLSRVAPEERAALFDALFWAELKEAQRRNRSISSSEYLRRYPDYAETVTALLALLNNEAIRDFSEEPTANDTTRVHSPKQADPPSPTEVGSSLGVNEATLPMGDHVSPGALGFVGARTIANASVPRPSVNPGIPETLPHRVGKYVVQKLLGRGGYGRVYLCHDPDLDDLVAVKVLRTEKHNDDLLGALRDEARKSRQLHNRGAQVVQVLDVGMDQAQSPFMVMKYLSGGSLSDQLRQRRVYPWREAVELVAEVAATLTILHAEDIYHRDIKSLNILLDDRGKPYLGDFGLATRIQSIEWDSAGHSPGYASPEQVQEGHHRIDGRSDLFSLGVVFYQLLTGKPPVEFQSGVRGDYERRISDPELVIPPVRQRNAEVPPAVAELCERCLKWNRAERLQSAADLKNGLQRLLVEPRPGPSRAWIIVAAAGVFLSGLGLARFWPAQSRKTPAGSSSTHSDAGTSRGGRVNRADIPALAQVLGYTPRRLLTADPTQKNEVRDENTPVQVDSETSLLHALGVIAKDQPERLLECTFQPIEGNTGLYLGADLRPPDTDAFGPVDSLQAWQFHALVFEPNDAGGSFQVTLRHYLMDQTGRGFRVSNKILHLATMQPGQQHLKIRISGGKIGSIELNSQRVFPPATEHSGGEIPLPDDSTFGIFVLHKGQALIRSVRVQ